MSSNVFIVCTKLFSHLNREGEVTIVSVHPNLETANDAARQLRNEYFEDQRDCLDITSDDLEDLRGEEDDHGEKFFDEFEPVNGEGETWQVYVEERPFSGSTPAPIEGRSSYGPMVTIPVGQRLLRGAQSQLLCTALMPHPSCR